MNTANSLLFRKFFNGFCLQTIKEAVDARRLHHQLFPMNLNYEDGITTVTNIIHILIFITTITTTIIHHHPPSSTNDHQLFPMNLNYEDGITTVITIII